MNCLKTTYKLLFWLFWLPFFVAGQSEGLEFKIYGFEEGLSHRNVFKVQQDQEGYIWVATINGLNRFDGLQFIAYSSDSEEHRIPYDYISDMLIGEDSLIWLAHPNAMSLLNPNTNQIRLIETDTKSALYNLEREANSLARSKEGQMYTVTYAKESGISHLQHIETQSSLADLRRLEGTFARRAILVLQNGNLLVSGQENEVWEISPDGALQKVDRLGEEHSPGFSLGWVTAMQQTADETLWVLLNSGELYTKRKGAEKYKLHTISRSSFGRSVCQSFLVEKNENIWIGGIGVLWHFNANTGQIEELHEQVRELTKNTCTFRQIFSDATGVIWLASDFGLVKAAKSDKLFSHYLSEGNEYCNNGFCSMRGICGDDRGNVYFNYYNSIHVLNTRNDELRPLFPQGNFSNPPFGLLHHQDALWTGNGKRIDLLTMQLDTILPGEPVAEGVIAKDKNDLLWLACENRLYSYDSDQKILKPFVDDRGILHDDVQINYIHFGQSSNALWLGTNADGLLEIRNNREIVKHFTTAPESEIRLSHNRIIGIYETAKGVLWLATANGLQSLDFSRGEYRTYLTEQGLPNNFINGLLSEGDSAIWASTDNGLSRLDIKSNTFSNFFKEDGLSANEFNRISFHRSDNGRLFFGGLNGVNAFYPGAQFLREKQLQKSKILFTSFSHLDGRFDSIISKTIGLSKARSIELSHKDRFFTFEFALANYKNPGENLYSYLLEGYDTEWSEPSSLHTARFNDIPPGDYVFRVRSSVGNGGWNSEELTIALKVKEAYYKTWWFFTLCGLGVLSLWYALFRYRIYTLRIREKQLEAEVKLRTSELTREKKKSDDLLLNILPAETAEELKKYGKAQAKRYDSVTILFSDFKDFTHIASQMDPEELVAEIDHSFSGFDLIMDKYNLEKIKTIGDAYMCAGGIPVARASHAADVVRAALEIQDFLTALAVKRKREGKPSFTARIGIHTGPVVTGIVGTKKFAYDIWGDAVNIAARLEGSGEAGKVNISESTYLLVKDIFECTHRGRIKAKNTNDIDMYFVHERKRS